MTTDNGTTNGPAEQQTPPAPQAPAPEVLTLTPAALDARLARAKAGAAAELLGELGLKSKDELASLIKEHREAQSAQQTEAERERARAAEATAAANAATEALKTERLSRAVIEAALKAGIPGERVGAVARLIDHAAITYGGDGAILGADEAVTALIAENAWITAGATRGAVGTGAGGSATGAGGNAGGLSADQQWAAKITGVAPERYAAAAQAKPGDANAEYVASALEQMAAATRRS